MSHRAEELQWGRAFYSAYLRLEPQFVSLHLLELCQQALLFLLFIPLLQRFYLLLFRLDCCP